MKFNELDLPPEVLSGIEHVGFVELTPVQERAIPQALAGKDVAAQAQTGTGKTAAFLISLFTHLLRNPRTGKTGPRALILAPTRELVVQIAKDAEGLGKDCPLVIQPIFGGVDYEKQRQKLRDGVDIIVATPGRLIDYFKQKVFTFKSVEMLVIDEADRMFDMGFIRDLRYLLRRLPPLEKRQSMLFSATLSLQVMELSYEFMDLEEKVEIAPEKVTADRIEQILYHTSYKEKFPFLLNWLRKTENASRVLIFVNTKREGEQLSRLLLANGYDNAFLSGDLPQKKRIRVLERFRLAELPVLVATDVASRGIHIDGVTHVINYDLPQDAEDYVHRIGRTARAGASGTAICLADENLIYHLEEIEELLGYKIPADMPEDDHFCWDYKRAAPRPKKRLPIKKGTNKRPRPRRKKSSSPQQPK